MKLDSNNHSVFLMYYHLVLVVKYRRNVIDDTISDYAKDKFVSLGENYNNTLVEWSHDMDHVHILFNAHKIQNYPILSTLTKVLVPGLSKRNLLSSGRGYGKRCSGREVFVC